MNFSQVDRLIELLPDDIRLMRQAKSGDTHAFIKLYDVYVERVYRYIYCQVVDDHVAEGITFQVFFNAWKQLDMYTAVGLPFISWLYSIAQNQVNLYYRTHKTNLISEQEFLVVAGHTLDKEVVAIREALQFFTEEERQVLILKYVACMPIKNIARLMTLRESDIRVSQFRALQMLAGHLEEKEIKVNAKKISRILAECQTKLLNDTSTVDELLERYSEYKTQLGPLLRTVLSLSRIRDVSPLFTFIAYTREALLNYVSSHPQRLQKRLAPVWRSTVAYVALILVLLFTGTVRAQSSLPGESLYTWKRASESVWRAVSLNSVATDIAIANRRLEEWVQVSKDPLRKTGARNDYLEALTRLKTTKNADVIVMIIPALQSQRQTLANAGLYAPELDDYLSIVSTLAPPVPTVVPPTVIVPTVVIPTQILPTATVMNIIIIPTATDVAPEIIPPTATIVPTEIPPTATVVPTDIPPTATVVPTDIPPTETVVPTEIIPLPTDIPTDIVPTESPAPTDDPFLNTPP